MGRILIASDHAGYELKNLLIKNLPDVSWEDLGPNSKDSVDYPDFADLVARKIQADPSLRGILICGSGQGMAIRANKYPAVRAALGWNEEIVKLSREHNDANILCLGSRFTKPEEARAFTQVFLSTPFEGGRHSPRVAKLSKSVSC